MGYCSHLGNCQVGKCSPLPRLRKISRMPAMVGPCLVSVTRAGLRWRAEVRVRTQLVSVVIGSQELVTAVAEFAPCCARRRHTIGALARDLSAYVRRRFPDVLDEDRDYPSGTRWLPGEEVPETQA